MLLWLWKLAQGPGSEVVMMGRWWGGAGVCEGGGCAVLLGYCRWADRAA